MGEITTLLQIIDGLHGSDDDATIYAIEPWRKDSPALLVSEESHEPFKVVGGTKYTYFLEVSLSKQFLSEYTTHAEQSPSLEQKCERLIQYAIDDA